MTAQRSIVFFQCSLGDMFTYPAGLPNICENRIVDMFHSCTESCIKDKIIKAFTSDLSPLPVVIATTAFGMGIDVSNIRIIIHFGSCEDVETYVQAISHAGHDGKVSKAASQLGCGDASRTSSRIGVCC